jgi:bla regulator protein BlaR1
MKSLESLIPSSIAEAVGSTLLHSLWQLSALALILMLVLTLLPQAASKLRYWSAITILGLMLLMPMATFAWFYQPDVATSGSATYAAKSSEPFVVQHGNVSKSSLQNPASVGLLEQISAVVRGNSYLFFGIWMSGVILFSLRFAGGCWQVNRLRKRQLEIVPEELLRRFTELKEKLGIRRNVDLRFSAAINTPMVIGVLKPMVLLPVGLLSGLSMEQVECILVHELAHVRRWDYFVNLLQSTVEIVLFFHPAIWWVSRVIRQERENCCDVLVVELPSSKIQYARALLSLEVMRQQRSALALGSQDGELASRIRRITGNAVPPVRKVHSRGLLFGLMLLAAVLLVGSQAPVEVKAAFPFLAADQKNPTPLAELSTTQQDSPITKIVIKENGEEVAMDFDKQGKVVSATRNGKEVPKEEIAVYQSKADEILQPNAGGSNPAMPPMPNFGDIPPFPPMPPMPNFGANPPLTPVPPMADPNSADFDSKTFESQMEQFGKQMEEWGKAFSKEFESKDWEQFGKDAGIWAEGLAGHALAGEETAEMKALHKELERIQSDIKNTKDQRRREELQAEQEQVAEKLGELHGEAMERNMGDFERRMEEWGNQFGAEMEKMFDGQTLDADKMARKIEIEVERTMKNADRAQSEADRAQAEADKAAEKARSEGARAERAADIIGTELVADHLVAKSNSYRLKINNRELQVNGKQQSDALHAKYQRLLEQQLGLKLGKDWVVFQQNVQ